MAKKRTTRVFIETREFWLVRRAGGLRRAWCEGCGGEVEQFAAEHASRVAGVGLRTLCRMIEAGLLHSTETPDGTLLVCVNTLTERSSEGD